MFRQLWSRTKFSPSLTKNVMHYSQPGKKAKPASRLPAQKQTLRKKQKEEAYKSISDVPSNQKDMLTEALFTPNNESSNNTNELMVTEKVLDERATISKAWSRLQMLRQQTTSSWERAYLQSKMDAMKELRIVSLELADAANEIDYSLPPSHRRIPTDTPPDPSKFPFTMSILHNNN